MATLHRAVASCALGHTHDGLPLLSAMVDAWQGLGRDADGRQRHPVLMTPYFAGQLARALYLTGDRDRAAEIVAGQLCATRSSGEHFWDGALHELRKTLENTRELT